ncbi:MAG: hypothetical protein Q4G06_05535 [Clostridia bacterium]|nr:hypothetical protein [Clostridia bacterium]
MRYLLEYTIEIVCKGNRSECARRMGLEYPELRKFRKRMSEGGGSARITEALLEMYWRENLSVDKALAAYTNSRAGQDIEDLENECNELVLAVRTAISENQRIAHGETQLLRAAYNFLEELERSFCNSTCLKTKYQETPCPVNRFIEYLKWAKDELPE